MPPSIQAKTCAEECDEQSPLPLKIVMRKIFRAIFGMSDEEVRFSRRGFHQGDAKIVEHLESAGKQFLAGYNHVLQESPESLAENLGAHAVDHRGFRVEGAAMACALLDRIPFTQRTRLRRLHDALGDRFSYLIHVGAGWILGRLPVNPTAYVQSFVPLYRWLVLDGFGFHQTFFWRKGSREIPCPSRVVGYGKRSFDQGVGRALWFRECADADRIAERISDFCPQRRGDLWSGVGLAAVYAGEASRESLRRLRDLGGVEAGQIAQGAAFAAKARHRAGNATSYTDLACWIFCGMSGADAAAVTDAALENLPANNIDPPYEIWRQRIRKSVSPGKELTQ